MSGRDPVRQLARAIAFGRHVPLSRIARRIELDVKRRVRQYTGTVTPSPPAVPCAHRPPLALFKPRHGMVERTDKQWRFTFLNRTCPVADTVDWRAGGEGPVNQLWCMNLHYMEYLEEVGDRQFADLAGQWIGANPPYARACWKDSWNSYTVSLRTVVWMQQLARRGLGVDGATRAMMVESLAQQLHFLEDNLETDIGGNHVIKNIKALIWGSAFFTGPAAERWRALGLQLLAQELPRQILKDGMHYERSPSYHDQVFADLIEIRQVLGRDPFGGMLDDTLARMAQVAVDLAHPDGRVALLNDAGLSMAHAPEACVDAHAALLGRARPEPRAVFALRDAGYFGLRAGDTYLVADCGRLAPDDLPAHGHSDVLSFEWTVAGERVIVDQGVFEYSAGERRHAARSAANHNTLCFVDADQADHFGAFRCGRRPDVAVQVYEQTADGFMLEGTHSGFKHLPGAPAHVRRFVAAPAEIEIRDRIEGSPDRAAHIRFLLHPDCRVEPAGQAAKLTQGPATVHVTSTEPIHIEDAVWWPDMGLEQNTKRLVIGLAPGVREVTTVLSRHPASQPSLPVR